MFQLAITQKRGDVSITWFCCGYDPKAKGEKWDHTSDSKKAQWLSATVAKKYYRHYESLGYQVSTVRIKL